MINQDNQKTYIGTDGLLYCAVCREPLECAIDKKYHHLGLKTHPHECRCKRLAREKEEAQHARRLHENSVSHLKAECFSDTIMQNWTFSNSTQNLAQLRLAHDYAANWKTMYEQNRGLLFWGGVGTGKSYAAACIANALCDQEIAVKMTNLSTVMNDLMTRYENREMYLKRLCNFPLLILDDYGMERGTEYGLEQAFQVIDMRMNATKPLIITTNLSLKEFRNASDLAHQRIYDRILSICTPVAFTRENLRAKGARNNPETMKTLLSGACV